MKMLQPAPPPTSHATLFAYSASAGPIYGTEDFALFLYSLVKMQRPQRLVEIGTGTGVSTLWMAQALKENGAGSLLSIDDGSHWNSLKRHPGLKGWVQNDPDLHAYCTRLATELGLTSSVEFLKLKLPPWPRFEVKVDLLFSDFMHGPQDVIAILRHFLPQMSDVASIFIDSAATHWPSYLLLEKIVEQFGRGQVPLELIRGLDDERRHAIRDYVATHRFTLVHLTEMKTRQQNGTSWLKIEPVDVLPHPMAALRQ